MPFKLFSKWKTLNVHIKATTDLSDVKNLAGQIELIKNSFSHLQYLLKSCKVGDSFCRFNLTDWQGYCSLFNNSGYLNKYSIFMVEWGKSYLFIVNNTY